MPSSSPRPFDALGGVPGAHLGLQWSGTTPADLGDVVELSRRCEDADGAGVRLPRVVVERTLAGPATVSMVGRDRRGTLRACAAVRLSPDGTQVAIRALVDPVWRGRGIGRAVLAWQDGWARDLLGDTAPATVAVPIAAPLIDRRRLYTAAGFSCRSRVEHHVVDTVNGDGDGDGAARLTPPGWTVRHLQPGEGAGLAELTGPDAHGFVAAAMTVTELAETCEPALSLAGDLDGVARAAVLVHRTTDAAGRAAGWARALLAGEGSEAVLRPVLAQAAAAAGATGLHRLHLYTTPATSARWRGALADLGAEAVDVELLYSIETT